MKLISSLAILLLVAIASAGAQEHDPSHHSSYADRERSEIAALTPTEIEHLRAGEGMGLAMAAELNHYPGPKHVLEMAGDLGLEGDQREAVERSHARMLEAARALGQRVIEAERTLDRRFAHAHIDEATLRDLTQEIAALRGELRFVHLRAHLETRAVLTTEQITRYDELRGYSSDE